ncbi:Abi family protein [Cellulomonas citrea]|uniref:Abi family protein n=1 Tax=Cellulomonas citrea TaxID=1909423 RepID=UPI0013594945|nr:Abi family protein [Cellulomonas citrea]
MYDKPHLSYADQLAKLESRGLACGDREAGLALLRSVGYYRLSAYVYPFREMLPPSEQCSSSPVSYRAAELRPGVTLDHVRSLLQFDRQLRARLLDGLEVVEVGLKTQVAHVLGERDPLGHLSVDALDGERCAQLRTGLDVTAFDAWLERYNKLQADARHEDYVRHHLVKYGDRLPIWVAIEFLDFGAVIRLYELLDRRDQNRVAAELGVKGGRLLVGWLKALNYLRNTAAHHARLWNRTPTLKVGRFNQAQVGPLLAHAASAPSVDRIYRPIVITAYLTRQIDPSSRWPINLRDVVRKFPAVPYVSPELDMGFPADWTKLEIWRP